MQAPARPLEDLVIGREVGFDYLHTNAYALRLKVPSDVSQWMTGPEAFQSRDKYRTIRGIPANLGVYRLCNGLPVFDLLAREGNPLAQQETLEGKRLYSWIRMRGADWMETGGRCGEAILPTDLQEPLMAAITTGKSITVEYDELRLNDDELEVREDNTPGEKRLFKGAFGTQSPEQGTTLDLLRPADVVRALSAKPDGLIALACYLDTAQKYFTAVNRFVIWKPQPC